jgi:hypothetical protein
VYGIFHQQFIIKYASYVEPLLAKLSKGNKWNWFSALQNAFETLSAKFADSIHLADLGEKKGHVTPTLVERPSVECYSRRVMTDITT